MDTNYDESSAPNDFKAFINPVGAKYDRAYWSAVRNGPFACLVFDFETLDIVCASRIVARSFGFSSEDLEQGDLSNIWPAMDFKNRMEFLGRTANSVFGSSDGEMFFRNKDGEVFSESFVFLDLNHPTRRLRIVFFPGIQKKTM